MAPPTRGAGGLAQQVGAAPAGLKGLRPRAQAQRWRGPRQISNSFLNSSNGSANSSNGHHQNGAAPEVAQAVPSKSQAKPTAFGKQSVVSEKAEAAPAKEFLNTNRYHVPLQFTDAFETEWKCREVAMRDADGFLDLIVDRKGEDYTVTSRWASIPQWEAFSCSPVARRSHLPLGVWQYVPKKGDGFPDDFIPFKDMTQPVNAKY